MYRNQGQASKSAECRKQTNRLLRGPHRLAMTWMQLLQLMALMTRLQLMALCLSISAQMMLPLHLAQQRQQPAQHMQAQTQAVLATQLPIAMLPSREALNGPMAHAIASRRLQKCGKYGRRKATRNGCRTCSACGGRRIRRMIS